VGCLWQVTPQKQQFAPPLGQSVTLIGLRADANLVLRPLKPMPTAQGELARGMVQWQ
jgi:hypothetical protein